MRPATPLQKQKQTTNVHCVAALHRTYDRSIMVVSAKLCGVVFVGPLDSRDSPISISLAPVPPPVMFASAAVCWNVELLFIHMAESSEPTLQPCPFLRVRNIRKAHATAHSHTHIGAHSINFSFNRTHDGPAQSGRSNALFSLVLSRPSVGRTSQLCSLALCLCR